MPAVLTFLIVASLILGLYRVLVVGPQRRERRRLRERLSATSPSGPVDVAAHDLLLAGDAVAGGTKAWWNVRPLRAASVRLTHLRDQSGIHVKVPTVAIVMGSVALVMAVTARILGASGFTTIVSAAIGASFPVLALLQARSARLRRFEELLPEATDVIARALRAGQTLPAALQIAGDELPDPVGAEFRMLHEHFRFGAPLSDVLRQLAERVPLVDTRFLVTAILIQRETGGNLPELLDNLAAVIRDRFRVRRKVRSVTAHGRLSGWILSAIPPVMGVLLLVMTPESMQSLAADELGRQLLAGALVLEAVGVLFIRRIVRVEY
jgi:tight adherence protein B